MHRATLNAMAFNEPSRLETERQVVLADIRRPACVTRGDENRELLRRGAALAERIERGRVLEN